MLEHDIRQPKNECSRIVIGFAETKAFDSKRNGSNKGSIDRLDLEAKCIAVNQMRSEYLAIGCNDPYARVYDRRALRLRTVPDRNNNNGGSSNQGLEKLASIYFFLGEFFLAVYLI